MEEDPIVRCLRELAGEHNPSSKQLVGEPAAPPYPIPWLLLNLLSMLPPSSKLKRGQCSSQEQLVALVAGAEAGASQALQSAAKLFAELDSCGPSTRRQLAAELCANPDACQLLVHSIEQAWVQRRGQQLEALLRAECSIVGAVWALFGERHSRPPTSSPQVNGSPQQGVCMAAAAALRDLETATWLMDHAASCSGSSSFATEALQQALSQQGPALLRSFDWLEQQAAGMHKEQRVTLSHALRSWAVLAAAALQQLPPATLYSISGMCRQLVSRYLGSTLARLNGCERVRSSWFRPEGPLTGMALICSSLAQVLSSPSCKPAEAAARSLATDHALDALRLLRRCLSLGARQVPEPADGSSGAVMMPSSAGMGRMGSTGAIQGCHAGPATWQGLPTDAAAAGAALVQYVQSALQLAAAMERKGMGAVPPGEVLALEAALRAVVDSGHSMHASWMPSVAAQQLQQVCCGAVRRLERLFADSAQLLRGELAPETKRERGPRQERETGHAELAEAAARGSPGASGLSQENMKPAPSSVSPSTPQQQPSWADVCRHGQAGAASALRSHPVSEEFSSGPRQAGTMVLPGLGHRPAAVSAAAATAGAAASAAAREGQGLASDWEQTGASGGMHAAGGSASQEGRRRKGCWGAGIITDLPMKVVRWLFS